MTQTTSPLPLKEQLKALELLQELDVQIDQLQAKKSQLPALLKTLDQSLQGSGVLIDSKNKEIQELEKAYRQSQAAIELNQDRIQRTSKRLEDVQNSKEFQAASKEMEQLKRLEVQLSAQRDKTTQDLDAAKKQLAALQEEQAKIQAERRSKDGENEAETGRLNIDLDKLLSERSKYLASIHPATLSRYDRARGARGGIGIVPAIQGRCKGCNMMLPPQLNNEVHKNLELHACPSCHRILYSCAP